MVIESSSDQQDQGESGRVQVLSWNGRTSPSEVLSWLTCVGLFHKISVWFINQFFSNFNMHGNCFKILLKCRLWLNGSGMGPDVVHFWEPPEGGCITQTRTLSSSIVDPIVESPCGKRRQNLPSWSCFQPFPAWVTDLLQKQISVGARLFLDWDSKTVSV